MTQPEADAIQALISAAVRVVRTPFTGVDICSPMARAVFGLTIQLAAAGVITVDEAKKMGGELPQEVIEAECPE